MIVLCYLWWALARPSMTGATIRTFSVITVSAIGTAAGAVAILKPSLSGDIRIVLVVVMAVALVLSVIIVSKSS